MMRIILTFFLFALSACGGDPAPALNGESCGTAGDCESGVCLTEVIGVEFPGGYCTAECETHGDCAEDEFCLSSDEGNFCYIACASDCDCRAEEGYGCAYLDLFGQWAACLPDALRRSWQPAKMECDR